MSTFAGTPAHQKPSSSSKPSIHREPGARRGGRAGPDLGGARGAAGAPPVSDGTAFAMAMFAYAGIGLLGPRLEERARQRIEGSLAAAAQATGRYELVWGPCVKRVELAPDATNTMFVVRSVERPQRYVIAVAGTNPTSVFDWMVEDLHVARQIDWRHAGGHAPGAAIAMGTAIGLSILQEMRPTGDRPGAGRTLGELLKTVTSEDPSITVTGHSLGGALSAVLAQWLADTQGKPGSWDPDRRATIALVPFAGPSPGNRAFAAHCDGTFGSRLRRRANRLDVVPQAWSLPTLDRIPDLYAPAILRPRVIAALARVAKWLARNGDYLHVDAGAAPLPGAVREDLLVGPTALLKYSAQMIYQHLDAYYPWFGFQREWAPWLRIPVISEVPQALLRAARPRLAPSAGPAEPPVPRKVLVGSKRVVAPAQAEGPEADAFAMQIERSLARHA